MSYSKFNCYVDEDEDDDGPRLVLRWQERGAPNGEVLMVKMSALRRFLAKLEEDERG